MKKEKQRKYSTLISYLGIGILSLTFIFNIVFAAISFGTLYFESMPLGAGIWLISTIVIIAISLFFIFAESFED